MFSLEADQKSIALCCKILVAEELGSFFRTLAYQPMAY